MEPSSYFQAFML
uniref:Uncharacterized protein n=1 Tax=Anguilla anguilla TaxID=7936 RepID=A0A0E9RR47_ANGAN